MFCVPKGLYRWSVESSSECTGLQSWDSGEVTWSMTFGIQVVTELLQPLSAWPHFYLFPVSYETGEGNAKNAYGECKIFALQSGEKEKKKKKY